MATNRADTLDPALLRPGRLDRKIEFPIPDRRQKRLVFQVRAEACLPCRGILCERRMGLPAMRYCQWLCSGDGRPLVRLALLCSCSALGSCSCTREHGTARLTDGVQAEASAEHMRITHIERLSLSHPNLAGVHIQDEPQ
jgi:hypothetical protein